MIRFALPAITAVLMLSSAIPVSAQAVGPTVCRMPIEALDNATPPSPTANATLARCETATRPWSAPVGHRQPQAVDAQAADVTSSISIDRALMQENARIDRLIQGICRGC
jgi:hypothetical protein